MVARTLRALGQAVLASAIALFPETALSQQPDGFLAADQAESDDARGEHGKPETAQQAVPACARLCGTPWFSHEIGVLLGLGAGTWTGDRIGVGARPDRHVASADFRPLTGRRALEPAIVTAVALGWARWGAPALFRRPYQDESGKSSLACSDCKPEPVGGPDGWVHRHLLWHGCKRGAADRLSDSTLLFSLTAPVTFLLTADQTHKWTDLTAVAESVALTAALTQTAKYAAKRRRPYARSCSFPCGTSLDAGSRLSFFSGHAASAFAVASSVATIADRRGYAHVGWIRGVGFASAGLTSYLRIAADRHFLSDVVVGAGVGWFVGRTIPRRLSRMPARAAAASFETRELPAVAPLSFALGDRRGGVVVLNAGVGAGGGAFAQISRHW